jgi:hypothetical protein
LNVVPQKWLYLALAHWYYDSNCTVTSDTCCDGPDCPAVVGTMERAGGEFQRQMCTDPEFSLSLHAT